MYYLYFLVPYNSSYLCASYYGYFDVLIKLLRSPCNTGEIGGNPCFLSRAAPQDPVVALKIFFPLPSIHLRRPRPVCSGPSNRSYKSGLSLQVNFFRTFNLPKGLISPRDLMITLPELKIEIDTMNPSPIQIPLPSLYLFSHCTDLILPILLS